jgi:hypothetical protein
MDDLMISITRSQHGYSRQWETKVNSQLEMLCRNPGLSHVLRTTQITVQSEKNEFGLEVVQISKEMTIRPSSSLTRRMLQVQFGRDLTTSNSQRGGPVET